MTGAARQLCPGSSVQLMVDADTTVECPKCQRKFSSFTTTRNRAQVCPIVPGHLPDREGLARIELFELKRRSATPRPF